MKKIFFAVMAVVAVSFASCTKKVADAPVVTDADTLSVVIDTIEVADSVTDSDVCFE